MSLSQNIMYAGGLAGLSLALFIGSMVSYGLFSSKGCSDSSPNGNFQKCNAVNIFIAVTLFAIAAGVYTEKIPMSEQSMIMLIAVVSLVLFITGMIQYSAVMNTVSCDATTVSTLKNWNMLVWMVAVIALVLSSYMYYQKQQSQTLQFKYFFKK